MTVNVSALQATQDKAADEDRFELPILNWRRLPAAEWPACRDFNNASVTLPKHICCHVDWTRPIS